jgi:hypothetical protein
MPAYGRGVMGVVVLELTDTRFPASIEIEPEAKNPTRFDEDEDGDCEDYGYGDDH